MITERIPDTPCRVPVRLVCPDCSQALQVEMLVTTQLTVEEDSDGDVARVLAPKVKKQTIAHVCHQATLDDAVHEFQRTTRELIAEGDVTQVTLTADGRTVDVATGEVLDDEEDES